MEEKSFPTPKYSIQGQFFGKVYEPAEDTFLLLDALEKDCEAIRAVNPNVAVEIGCGSGVVSVFLSRLLKRRLCLMATDIDFLSLKCTLDTANLNGITLDVIQCDLMSALLSRLVCNVDILLFNPPYVSTGIEARCWSGGLHGRQPLERLLKIVNDVLSPNGLFYAVALKANDVSYLLSCESNLIGEVVIERRCGIEFLYVLKFKLNTSNR